MKHKDIKKSRTYWAFHNANADRQDNNEPFDHQHTKVFSDFLQEHGDARHVLLSHAAGYRPTTAGGRAEMDHPERPGAPIGSGKGDDVGAVYDHEKQQRDNAAHAWPVEAFKDNANTQVELHRQVHQHGENYPGQSRKTTYHPILHWQVHIPRTVSSTGKTRSTSYASPVSANHLHDFIDAMPDGATKKQWKQHAAAHGWRRTEEAPTKLRRVTATHTGLAGAVGQSGSSQHDQRVQLVKKIFAAGGLKAGVFPVLHHGTEGDRPSVAAIAHGANPDHTSYVLANAGMMAKIPSWIEFTPGQGEDMLHVFDSPHPISHVAGILKQAKIGPFTSQTKGGGTRIFALNPSGDPNAIGRSIDATRQYHTPGTGRRYGASDGANASTTAQQTASRTGYRSAIRAGEQAAGA